MFVYALQGKSNTGKSLVLATLAVKILREYKDKINVSVYDVEKIKSQIERKYQAIRAGKRCASPYVSAVFEIDGIAVGIHTSGDDSGSIKDAVSLFKGKNSKPCDIGFCACRTRSVTVRKLEELREEGNQVEFIQKEFVSTANATCESVKQNNDRQAQKLFEILKKYIRNNSN